jgi:predicted metalloprotease with PDZ domain
MQTSALRFVAVFALIVLAATPSLAQAAPIQLTVDATQVAQRIVKTRMVMDVKPGPLTLYYPKWIPGEHEPDGPIANLAALKFSANGQTIPWRRDLLDVFTFHVDVPQGASKLDVSFDYLEPAQGASGYSGAASSTDKLVVVSWNQNLLYPAGTPAEQLNFQPTLILPKDWKFGTSLRGANANGSSISFSPVALDRLVDSPVIAGLFYRTYDLTPAGEPIHHEIDIVADSEAALAMPPELQRGLTNLVAETGKLFGARHYREYHFLLTLSDHVAHFGLEHHESDDSRLEERVMLGPEASRRVGSLLSHEFVHSWNGKYRRPKDLSTPYYQAPEITDLLWVYEGLTDYLGNVLATRSGLFTVDDYHEYIAGVAASLGPGTPGRTWRPLLDTAVAIPGMFDGSGFGSWRRGADYYPEGDLLWLEADSVIRRQTQQKKSLDDFLRAFHGGASNGPELKTYTFEELVQAINAITSYDWAKFFNDHLNSTAAEAPVLGLDFEGWRVIYSADPLKNDKSVSATTYSIGLVLGADGTVVDSFNGRAAFSAGVSSGMKVVGVNGRVYAADILADAIKASTTSRDPITLLLTNNGFYLTCKLDYHAGEHYPHLQRNDNPDMLADVLKPLSGSQ